MFLCLRSVFWGNGAGPGAGAPLSTSRCQCCRLTQVRRRRRQPPPPPIPTTPLYRAVLLTPHPHSHHYNTYLINTFLTYPTPSSSYPCLLTICLLVLVALESARIMFVHVGVANTCAYLCAIRYKPFLLSLYLPISTPKLDS